MKTLKRALFTLAIIIFTALSCKATLVTAQTQSNCWDNSYCINYEVYQTYQVDDELILEVEIPQGSEIELYTWSISMEFIDNADISEVCMVRVDEDAPESLIVVDWR